MRKRFVVGNWKMHGDRASNRVLLDAVLEGIGALRDVESAVCVPFPYLGDVAARLQGTALVWGAQNLSEHGHGAFTGEVSAAMLADFKCRYVIVGHSERRQLFCESDAAVAAKFAAALAQGIKPILCLGETLEARDSGRTEGVIERQLQAVLDASGKDSFANAVLAYEPVWAIGTGRTATPQQVQAVHAFLRQRVLPETRILYGGSVKAANAAALFAMKDVDGGLIGGASLAADEFIAIVEAAARAAQQKG